MLQNYNKISISYQNIAKYQKKSVVTDIKQTLNNKQRNK